MHYARKVSPGDKVDLSKFDPNEDGGLSKEEAEAKTAKLGEELEALQALLYEASQTAVLIVLQGLDTSGKDGTIKGLVRHMNAQSCRVASFKVPTEIERAHDFLWRVHAVTPQRGFVGIFNRSHYEDVLVVKVHELAPKEVIKERYGHINAFERLLADSGTIVLKFFLHITKEEQEQRLLAREQDAEKAWKLSVGDWQERELWDKYQKAYETALTKCSTDDAPWFVVPANHKWFRNLAVMERVVEALRPYEKDWMKHLEALGREAKKELLQFRSPAAKRE